MGEDEVTDEAEWFRSDMMQVYTQASNAMQLIVEAIRIDDPLDPMNALDAAHQLEAAARTLRSRLDDARIRREALAASPPDHPA